jgi:PTS system mannose-specific IIA component
MVGVLIVTHGHFSEAIIKSMELVFGHQEKVEALTLNYGDDVKELLKKVREKAGELNDGDGVIVLVDLLGGSPCNVTAACIKEEQIQCITGLNMPMLISVLEERDQVAFEKLPEVAMESGKMGIVDLKQLIG